MISVQHRVRWRSRLEASGEALGAESEAVSEESDSAGVEAQSAAGVDLSKGIAFEAPKPKAVVAPEEEEESESKKVRVVSRVKTFNTWWYGRTSTHKRRYES